jgi:hypothetical protein
VDVAVMVAHVVAWAAQSIVTVHEVAPSKPANDVDSAEAPQDSTWL